MKKVIALRPNEVGQKTYQCSIIPTIVEQRKIEKSRDQDLFILSSDYDKRNFFPIEIRLSSWLIEL
jgi:hypothetical protein